MKKIIFYLLVICSVFLKKIDFEEITLKKSELKVSKEISLNIDQTDQFFKVNFNPANLLHKSDQRFMIKITSDFNTSLRILETTLSGNCNAKNTLLRIESEQGNLIFMSDKDFFLDENWLETKRQGLLYLRVRGTVLEQKNLKIEFSIQNDIDLQLGTQYVTHISPGIQNLKINNNYQGKKQNDFKKIRFQISTLLKDQEGKITGQLNDKLNHFVLNNAFENILGGVLDDTVTKLCRDEECSYQMVLEIQKTQQFVIETFFIQEIEDLSIYHLTEYYDRSFQDNSVAFYKLKYTDDIEELNISINLIPVTGETSLYVNPQNKPIDLNKYLYKEKGKLSKRVTISWDELQQMKATKQDLYIAVECPFKGEYLLKLDAHESHYRGRLSPGYSEAGFVKYQELAKYIVVMKPWENQKVRFTVKMQVFSGNADLHVKKCSKSEFCDITQKQIDKESLVVQNNNEFEKTLEVDCNKESCNFLVFVVGNENHGSHFEIIIQEEKFHYLMIPGHSLSLNLRPDENKYLKFSNPQYDNTLFLHIEPMWGSFNLYLDNNNQYPDENKKSFSFEFDQQKISLLNSIQNLKVNDILGSSVGMIYLNLQSKTSCKVSLKFYSQQDDQLSIHTLMAGKTQSGLLKTNKDIQYFQINLSLEEQQAQSVGISLIPQKGQFIMMASRGGRIPSLDSNDIISYDNLLDLSYKNYEEQSDYIIAVAPKTNNKNEELNYQFKISLSYSNKTSKLSPGLISQHTLNEKNHYQIQILEEMNNLLILKSIVDGYNITLCGVFSKDSTSEYDKCDIESADKEMGIFLEKEKINKYCEKYLSSDHKCYLNIKIEGNVDQLFSLGFTYNDLPFQLVQNSIITGPSITKNNYQINFIYHAEKDKGLNLYFNSKGKRMKVLSKLIDGNTQDQNHLEFPNQATFDSANIQTQAYITYVIYSDYEINSKGSNPEVLISIIPENLEVSQQEQPFDQINGFILQAYDNVIELTRTHIYNQHLLEFQDEYFYFYNNGSSKILNVYVNSNTAAFFEVSISQGKGIRPGYEGKSLKTVKGVNQVILTLNQDEVGNHDNALKGYYTVKVKNKKRCYLSIYWNNKANLDYFELNANFPQTIHIVPNKPLYFTFYNSEKNQLSRRSKNGNLFLHFQSDSNLVIYLKRTLNKDLVIPDEENSDYTSHLGPNGGIGFISIDSKDKNYCTDCSYVGVVQSPFEGQITILMNVEHSDLAINIVPGFTIPDTLLSHQGKTYRFLNTNEEVFYLNISMLSGFCNVFVDSKAEVNPNNAKEYFFLTKENQTHSYIKIDPEKYNHSSEYFIRVENPKLDPVTFTLSIYQNDIHSPIEIGVSKNVEVGANEVMDLFFQQKNNDKFYEIRGIIKKVQQDDQNKNEKQLLETLERLIQIGNIQGKGFQELETKQVIIEENRIYIQFEAQQSYNQKFNIRIKNILDFGFQIQLDVLSGQYKLLNLTDNFVDSIFGKNEQIYEAYGHRGRYWFLEMKMCYGETNVAFYPDYKSYVNKTNKLEEKLVSENNTIVYYVTLENSHIFVDISNKNTDKSVYKLVAYNEQDLNDNPYQEVVALNDGKIQVDTSSKTIQFYPLKISNFNDDSFDHKVIYTLYLSPNFKIMRFAKNCGKHLIDKVFQNPDIITQQATYIFNGSENFNKAQKVVMQIPEMNTNQRYYGIVIANIHLLTRNEGMVEPLRQSMTYYDEFIVVSGKVNVSINFWLPLVFVIGLLVILWYFINDYVFGEIRKFKDIKTEMKNISETNINVFDILESDFNVEEPVKKSKKKQHIDLEVETTESDDRMAPLDIDS